MPEISDEKLWGPAPIADTPPKGQRRNAIRDVAFTVAHEGATNHELIMLMEAHADAWGVLPRSNLFERYTRLLRIVREIRASGIAPRSPEATDE